MTEWRLSSTDASNFSPSSFISSKFIRLYIYIYSLCFCVSFIFPPSCLSVWGFRCRGWKKPDQASALSCRSTGDTLPPRPSHELPNVSQKPDRELFVFPLVHVNRCCVCSETSTLCGLVLQTAETEENRWFQTSSGQKLNAKCSLQNRLDLTLHQLWLSSVWSQMMRNTSECWQSLCCFLGFIFHVQFCNSCCELCTSLCIKAFRSFRRWLIWLPYVSKDFPLFFSVRSSLGNLLYFLSAFTF